MIRDIDRLFLRRAVELAERGLYSVSGNPRVGCIIVRDGAVLGRGWHVRSGEAHAEANAIDDAGGDIAGATAYVSLEPCCHHGRQPPCTDALIAGGIARVVGAMDDPDPRVAGKGYQRLREAGIAVAAADLPEARALNAGFILRITRRRPFVRIKLAASLDGRTAMASGESRWITSAAARADVQHWRARSSAIVTGIGTLLADDPALTVRDSRFATDGAIRQPLLAIADSTGRTPAHAKALRADRRVIAFAADDGATRVDLRALLQRLADEDCNEVLVEAGATLAGAFLRDAPWDEIILYTAPKLLGDAAQPLARLGIERLGDAPGARIADATRIGDDLRLILRPLHAPPASPSSSSSPSSPPAHPQHGAP